MGNCAAGHVCPSGPHGVCCGDYLADLSDMQPVADLLDHLQEAVTRGESHGHLSIKVQNIRAEFHGAIAAIKQSE
jgi:hypothetical protein